jgi:hypothetical protein
MQHLTARAGILFLVPLLHGAGALAEMPSPVISGFDAAPLLKADERAGPQTVFAR